MASMAGFTTAEIEHLEAAFAESPWPTRKELKEIKERTNIRGCRLKTWFDCRRRSTKNVVVTEKLEAEKQRQSKLIEAYHKDKYVTPNILCELGDRTGMTEAQIRKWFMQRRALDKSLNKDTSMLRKCIKVRADQQAVLNEAYQKKKKKITTKEMYVLAERVGLKQNKSNTGPKEQDMRIRIVKKQSHLLQSNLNH